MAVRFVRYFIALNSLGEYDNITLYIDDTSGSLSVTGNTQTEYYISQIYGYAPYGALLDSFVLSGVTYGIYAGLEGSSDKWFEPFARTAVYDPTPDPDTCDLIFLSILTTDETVTLNDGEISATAQSSYSGIQFSIDNITFGDSGIFTGLAPGTYTIYVKDSHGCTQSQAAVILPYGGGPAVYNERYYIEYCSVMNNSNVFKVSLKQRGWTGSSTRLIPGTTPCVPRYLNNDEDKYEAIVTSLLNINLINDGTFIMTDFYSNDERQWKVDQYFNTDLKWQGWLIPDEIKDYYRNGKYEITLTATDGLESLKGFQYIDDNLYPILGKLKLTEILQFCLAKLDYTATKRIICSIVSDLDSGSDYQYPSTKLWSDAFYDQDLNAFDCNKVIVEICTTFGWTLKQVDGNFIFSLANDLSKTTGSRIITEYDSDFVFIAESTNFPVLKTIGIGQDYKPVNPTADSRYDKALPKVSVSHDFGGYSIVNTNRSFEVGAVEDALPPGWTLSPSIYFNLFQLKQVSYAYSGNWVFRSYGNPSATGFNNAYSPDIPVTKLNSKLSISFSYLAVSPIAQGVPWLEIEILFTRTSDAATFYLCTDGIWYRPVIDGGSPPTGVFYVHRVAASFKNEWDSWTSPVNDTIPTTPTQNSAAIPGIGTVNLIIQDVAPFLADGTPIAPGVDSAMAYIDMDDLDVIISPFSFNNNPLTAETWNIINKTKVFLGQARSIDTILYDQPNNEFLNGNIFFNDTITNLWSVIGEAYDPASIGKILPIQIQANYQRPAIIWDGDIIADDVDMSMVFKIYGYGDRIFMPISMSHDQRAGIVTLQLKEIIEDSLVFDFQYIPKYSRNSRTIIS